MPPGKCEASTILSRVLYYGEKKMLWRCTCVTLLNGIERDIESNVTLSCRTDIDWDQRHNDASSSDRSIFWTGDPSSCNTHACSTAKRVAEKRKHIATHRVSRKWSRRKTFVFEPKREKRAINVSRTFCFPYFRFLSLFSYSETQKTLHAPRWHIAAGLQMKHR